MATDFTVILPLRQHFGNDEGGFDDIEQPRPLFVGPTKDFPFDCPGVNSGETAVLLFQSRDVDHQKNVFRVNDVDIFGGLPASPDGANWNGNIMLLEKNRFKLQSTKNVLHVESRNENGGGGDDIDDFIIDNVVIVYKTR